MKIIVFMVLWMGVVCLGQDPVLTPSTLSDSVKNQADNNSNIVWSDIDPGNAYKVDGVYDAGALGPFLDMTRTFINVVFPGGIPTDLINSAKSGFSMDKIYEILPTAFKEVGGYVFCILFGVLFLAIFPLVGSCFCVWRICGCCGGEMTQNRSPSTSCIRLLFCVIFLVLVVITGAGCICVYVSNDRMTGALEQFEPTFNDNIDDVFTFVNNTYQQIKRVLDDDLTFAIDVLKRDINNSDVLVGIPLRDKLLQVLNLNSIFNRLTYIPKVVNQFGAVEANNFNLTTSKGEYKTDIESWNNDYKKDKDNCSGCTLPDETELLPNNKTIDLTAMKTEIDNIGAANVDGKLQDAKDELNKIPAKVKTRVDEQKLVENIDNFRSEIDPFLSDFEEQIKTLEKSIDVDLFKSYVKEYSAMGKKYDKYRWYAGLGIFGVIMLVVVLQLLGLVFGFFGSSASTLPTKRGCVSTCGGNLLMASVGFIFIFSSILMLLTTLTFTIGSPFKRFLCQPLADPALTEITSLMKTFNVADPISAHTGGATIGEVTKDCADGKTVYTAFRLENQPSLNLSKILNYRQILNLESKISSVNIDFAAVTDALKELETKVTNINSSVQNLDAGPFKMILAGKPTLKNITEFIIELERFVNNAGMGTFGPHLTKLKSIRSGSYSKYIEARENLGTSVNVLDTDIETLKTEINKLPDELKTSRTNLTNNGPTLVQSVLNDLIVRIYKICDALITRAVTGLKEDIAPCSPIYNLFKSIFINGLCGHVLDSFNGFWFGIGWCVVFFIPSSIFAVKLAKHFRKMERLGGIDKQRAKNSKDVEKGKSGPSLRKRNSVGPSTMLKEEGKNPMP